MIVIVEGPDGGGKSILSKFLSAALDMHLQTSEGRPKYPGEFEERVARYAKLSYTVFDRHPVISQAIYGTMRGTSTTDMPTARMINELYDLKPLIIYCRATDLSRHVAKEYDSPDHLLALEKHADMILRTYDKWALDNAHIVYRIGENKQAVLQFARAWKHQ